MHSLSLWHHPPFFSPLSHTGIIISCPCLLIIDPCCILSLSCLKLPFKRNRYFSCCLAAPDFLRHFSCCFIDLSWFSSLGPYPGLFLFNLIHLSFSLKFFSNSVSFICFCSSCIFLASVSSFYNVICVNIILSWSCEGRRVGTCFHNYRTYFQSLLIGWWSTWTFWLILWNRISFLTVPSVFV